MNDKECPYEDSVTQAMHTGQWHEGLRTHVSQCKYCAEIIQVSRWMSSMAESCRDASPAPDPGVTWLKAQWAEQLRREERALRPVILAQVLAKSGVFVALAFLILWIWPVVNPLILRFLAWAPHALINPSIPSIQGPMARLSSPISIMLFLAAGCLVLMPRLRKPFG
jgi:hypothetical protein